MTKNPISSTNEDCNRKSFSDSIVGLEDQLHIVSNILYRYKYKGKGDFSVKMVYLDLYGYVLLRLTIDHLL